MSFLDSSSHECLKSELDIFQLPPTQTSIESGHFTRYYPNTSLDKEGPLDFTIRSGNTDFIDPQNIFLYTKSRILDTNGAVLARNADNSIPDKACVFPLNYFHATRYKNLEVYLNGKLISTNDNLYAYHSYIEAMLSFPKETKDIQLASSLFYKDVGGNFDDYDLADDARHNKNKGAERRWFLSRFSQSFEGLGRLHSGIFNQPKLLPNNCTLTIKLTRGDHQFCLMGKVEGHRYQVVIDEAFLLVCHKRVSDSIRIAQELALNKSHAKYAIRKSVVRFFTKASGVADLSEQNLVNGILPRRIIVGLVETAAFHGLYRRNPFDFKHFNVSEVVLRLDGNPIPFETIKTDFARKCHLQGYLSLLQATGRLMGQNGLDIHPFNDYPNGSALYGFDITPDFSESPTFNLLKEGKIGISISLNTPHDNSITLVCYLEYDTVLEIDKDRRIIYDNIG